MNPNTNSPLQSIHYTFPIYDGVSVVGFTCTIGSRIIRSIVKERTDAKTFDDAINRGELASNLEQSVDDADVFIVLLGNVPAGEAIKVNIMYLGDLSHDAEVNGYSLPCHSALLLDAARRILSRGSTAIFPLRLGSIKASPSLSTQR